MGGKCKLVRKTKTHEDFVNEIFVLVGNEYEVLGLYEKSNLKIKFKHIKCNNEFDMIPNNFLQGARCGCCFGKKKASVLKKININGLIVEAKKCNKCGQLKPLSEYSDNNGGLGGKKPSCRACNRNNKDKEPKWTDERIHTWITNYINNGGDLKPSELKKVNASVYNVITRKYGYRNYLKTLGADLNKVYQMEIWSKDKIIERIRTLHSKNVSLNNASMISNIDHRKLFDAGISYFGSWEKAITESGINYNDIRNDFINVSKSGKDFEKIVDELLTELKIDYSKGYDQTIQPDYIFKNNIWADAKLSEWSIVTNGCQTIEKYEPHCNLLFIIYMRGNENRDEMITKKTRIISIHKLIKQLPKFKQCYYLNKINEIDKEIKDNEVSIESKDSLKSQILDLYEDGVPLNSRNMQINYSNLYARACYAFGSWSEAITYSGFNYDNISKRKKLSKQQIYEIKVLLDDGLSMCRVAKSYGISRNVVRKIKKDYDQYIKRAK
jgi:hypothetical protein